jgi:glutamyl-Q tRNA(Asp) synthetase
LHFGSLVAAVASYLDARRHGGAWLVRIEDVDEPRCVPGADSDILRTLERFGLEWDEPVIYQSARTDAYGEALDTLRRHGFVYPCGCSRKDAGPVYAGTCRRRAPQGTPVAWRLVTDDAPICFNDRLTGTYCQNLAAEVGDFVVRRADGLFAYQLAVVVDDAAQGITDVVRGSDLLDSTPRQIWLQRLLGYPEPRYMHFPVVTNEAGEKLSKQTFAPPLRTEETCSDLARALRFLGFPLPEEAGLPPREMLRSAVRPGPRGLYDAPQV